MPLVMQKLEQGSLKENSLYEKAENEQKALDTRAREIKFILMREDCDKLVDSMQSVLDEVSLNKCLKNVKDFYKKYHGGEEYCLHETMILFYLNKLRNTYLTKGLEEPVELIFNLQEEILGLTKENGDKRISSLHAYWDKLIAKAKVSDKDLLKCDLRKISMDEYEEYFKPLSNLIYVTGIHFFMQKFTHDSLSLINHIYVSFLSCANPKKDNLNAYYYVLETLLKEITTNEYFGDIDCDFLMVSIDARAYEYTESFSIGFRTIEEFERSILSLQLEIWNINAKDKEYTHENLKLFKNKSLKYLDSWSKRV